MARCADCHRPKADYYMLHDALWDSLGVDGELCFGCLEIRLARPLGVDDLKLCPATVENPRARKMINALLRRKPLRK